MHRQTVLACHHKCVPVRCAPVIERNRPPAEVIADALTVHLGPSTARTAVRTFCSRLGLRAEDLSADDAPRLVEALRPMLRTLLGPEPADGVLESIRGHLAAGADAADLVVQGVRGRLR